MSERVTLGTSRISSGSRRQTKNWLTNMVASEWKKLIGNVIAAETIDSFTWRLGKYMDDERR